MAQVSISLGSNIDRERNLRAAVARLRETYGRLLLSPVYQTAAVGFNGDDFLNLVACMETAQAPAIVVERLKSIEDELGRDRSQPKFSARRIDLDLLTYDDMVGDGAGFQVPRDEILYNAFVLKPMADVMRDQVHPVSGKTYRQLWDKMAEKGVRIERVALDLG